MYMSYETVQLTYFTASFQLSSQYKFCRAEHLGESRSEFDLDSGKPV